MTDAQRPPPPPPRQRQPLQQQLGRYSLVRRLDQGQLSEVFWARVITATPDWQPHVVVKRLLPEHAADPRAVALWRDGVHLWSTLQHQNIVTVLTAEQVEESHLVALEAVWGVDLHRVVQRQLQTGWGRMPLAEVLLLGHRLCRALAYADAPHGDLDPGKVILGRDGSVRITGFGLHPLRRLAQGWSRPSRYRCPELGQRAGHPYRDAGPRLEHAADVYSVGRMLLELVTRRLVFPAGLQLEGVAPAHAAALRRFFERALAAQPRDRYADPRQLLDGWLEVVGAAELSEERLGRWVRGAFSDALI